ncbi:MAG: hypothetical protein V4757_07785 [Pseudomonadota bacterium]
MTVPVLGAALLVLGGVAAWGVAAWTAPQPHGRVVLSQAAAMRLAQGGPAAAMAPVARDAAAPPVQSVQPAPKEEAPEMAGHASGDRQGAEYVLREEEGMVRRVEVVPRSGRGEAPAVLSPFTAPLKW